MANTDTSHGWEQARRIADLVNPVPSSITTCVRFLKSDAEGGLDQCSKTSTFGLLRFLKSPSFKSPLYYAALTYRKKSVEQHSLLTDRDLINVFKPAELMILTPLIYLYRKIRRGCDSQEFTLLDGPLQRATDLGGIVGQVIPGIGFGPGVLAGAIRYLGLSMLLGIDKPNFMKYRRKLKLDGTAFDVNEEVSLWGTTHVQIASLLTQPIGLGQAYGDGIARGLLPALSIDQSLPPLALAFQAACIWTESLMHTSKVPQMMMKAEHYPSQADLQDMLERAETIYNEGSPYEWLHRGKDDIGREKTPALYSASETAKESGLESTGDSAAEDLIDQINPEDLEKLE